MAESDEARDSSSLVKAGSDPWADLALTLPIFVGYHLGVIALPVRNAADMVTSELVTLANNNILAYGALTLALGGAFVAVLVVLGRGHTLRFERFGMVVFEGIAYAIAMRLIAGFIVGRMFLAAGVESRFAGLVMSLGAGFYEEIAFRVILYGLGAKLISLLFPLAVPFQRDLVKVGWALVAAVIFSGWHYVGVLGDSFDAKSFVFRTVCGLVFTVIYVFRGFAPAVWTHALYDIWVLVF